MTRPPNQPMANSLIWVRGALVDRPPFFQIYTSSGTTKRSAEPCQMLDLEPPAVSEPIRNCALRISRALPSRAGGTMRRDGLMPRGLPAELVRDIMAARAEA